MDYIKKQIEKSRTISERSLSTYLRNLRILYNNITGKDGEPKDLKYLHDFAQVKKYLDTKTISTRKNNIASIIVGLKSDKIKNDEKIIEKYNNYLYDVANEYDSKMKENKKNERQTENWTSIKGLQNVLKYYQSKIRKHKINKKEKLNKYEMGILQKYVTLALYLIDDQNPPRRLEYAHVEILRPNSDSDEMENGNNYLKIYSRNKKEWIFNNYKTKKKYNRQVIKVGSKLNTVLNLWLKHNKGDYLLYNSRGQKMSENSLSKYLSKIFQDRLNKKISANMIRHIYISDLYKDLPNMKSMEKTAQDMGHSLGEQLKTYKKTD